MDDVLGERTLEIFIRSWTLIPSKGGVFEVTINGEKVFSKKALGRHAEPGEVKAIITRKVEELRPPGFVMPDDD
jgi:selenoprotein W-related protein